MTTSYQTKESPVYKEKLTLTQMRKASSLKGVEIAERCGVSYHSLRNWETGRTIPTITNVLCLLDIYGRTLSELDLTTFTTSHNV